MKERDGIITFDKLSNEDGIPSDEVWDFILSLRITPDKMANPFPEMENYSVEKKKPVEGNVHHQTFERDGYLYLTNYDDPFYVQRFDNWEQLRKFIAELEKAGKEAFGND